jgi:hypothetical protein
MLEKYHKIKNKSIQARMLEQYQLFKKHAFRRACSRSIIYLKHMHSGAHAREVSAILNKSTQVRTLEKYQQYKTSPHIYRCAVQVRTLGKYRHNLAVQYKRTASISVRRFPAAGSSSPSLPLPLDFDPGALLQTPTVSKNCV